MSTQKSDRARLLHVKEAIESIWSYTEHHERDAKTRDAVIRQLEIIGEACRQVSSVTQTRYSQVPWQEIIGMRHHIAHGYFQIDIKEVWDTVNNDLQPLQEQILLMLDDPEIR